jgi:phosphatidylglycerophosphate synthase
MAARILDSLMQGRPDGPMLRNNPDDFGPADKAGMTQQRQIGPRFAFACAGAGVAIASAGTSAVLLPAAGSWAACVAAGTMIAVVGLGLPAMQRAHPHGTLGPANVVTLLRAGIVALVAAALTLPQGLAGAPMLAWTMVAIVSCGLALDGVDGWLARRTGLSSAFGARFDMEVDAALAACLCLLVILSGKAGPWLLPLGFLRYVWVAAGMALPWLTGALPERPSRKLVCVVQIGALTALLAPVLLPPWSAILALVAMIALVWSFAVDALWLWRRHRP